MGNDLTDKEARQQAIAFILSYQSIYGDKKDAYETAVQQHKETNDEYYQKISRVLLGELINLPSTLAAMQDLVKTLAPSEKDKKDFHIAHLPKERIAESLTFIANFSDEYGELRRRRMELAQKMEKLDRLTQSDEYRELDREDDAVLLQLEILEKRFEAEKVLLQYEG